MEWILLDKTKQRMINKLEASDEDVVNANHNQYLMKTYDVMIA